MFNKNILSKISRMYLVFIIFTLLFVALASEVKENETLAIDTGILNLVRSGSNKYLDTFFKFFTNWAGPIGVCILLVLLTIIYIVKKEYYNLIFIALTIPGTIVLNTILKLIFQRTRPDLWEDLVTEKFFSFPSGHAMISLAIALTFIVITYRTKYRNLTIVISSIYILLIGYSRLYLGVHYPTDILGGWIISTAWVTIVTKFMMKNEAFKKDFEESTL